MAKKTKPAALFELMALSRKGVSAEDARNVQVDPAVPAARKPIAATRTVAEGSQELPPAAVQPSHVPWPMMDGQNDDDGPPPDRLLTIDQGRVVLSLNYISAATVLGGLLVLVLGAAVLGHRMGAARAQANGVDERTASEGGGEVGTWGLIVERLPGTLPRDRAEADKIVHHLGQAGIAARVVRYYDPDGKEGLAVALDRLVADPNSAQAHQLVRQVQDACLTYDRTLTVFEEGTDRFWPFQPE